MTGNEGGADKPRKLCLNCAYRERCQKRFSANVANGEVLCNEHAYDLELIKPGSANKTKDAD